MAFKVGWERDDRDAPIPPIVPPSPILADPELESPVAPDPLDGFRPEEFATEAIQLAIEYDPHPPFHAGTPRQASPAVGERAGAQAAQRQRHRAEQVARAVPLLDR